MDITVVSRGRELCYIELKPAGLSRKGECSAGTRTVAIRFICIAAICPLGQAEISRGDRRSFEPDASLVEGYVTAFSSPIKPYLRQLAEIVRESA